ncbi:MAG: DUF2007 domain-containing protein [Dehalococcoidia bacterium]
MAGRERNDGWVEVLTAPNQIEAEMFVEFLSREGIPARLRPRDSLAFLGGLVSSLSTRVLVRKEHEQEARSWLDATPAADFDEEPEPSPDGS